MWEFLDFLPNLGNGDKEGWAQAVGDYLGNFWRRCDCCLAGKVAIQK